MPTLKKKTVKKLFTLTPELAQKIDKTSKARFGDRQGHASMWLEMTLRNHFKMSPPFVEET